MSFHENDHDVILEIPDIKFEVDVFTSPENELVPYCKIDLEVDNIYSHLAKSHPNITDTKLVIKVSHLPFKPTEAFMKSSATESQKKLLDNLYENYYTHDLIKQRLLKSESIENKNGEG